MNIKRNVFDYCFTNHSLSDDILFGMEKNCTLLVVVFWANINQDYEIQHFSLQIYDGGKYSGPDVDGLTGGKYSRSSSTVTVTLGGK